jgi:ribosome assembly protein YihI (activator of Der GTPase)
MRTNYPDKRLRKAVAKTKEAPSLPDYEDPALVKTQDEYDPGEDIRRLEALLDRLEAGE